jgi:MFS transporter, ACS family, tartrate transporter
VAISIRHTDPGASALRKVRNRLVAFLGLLYFAAFIDRTNVGFAAAQMQRDLGFSDAVYGLGAGIFFIGYCLFEVPSNLILHRVGARRWIARIMISWGLLAGAMALVRGAGSFYLLRFLLGVAEAGFFPGVVYYLSNWVPAAGRARLIGAFMTAIPISTAVSGPISGALLRLDGIAGLAGWQWLFLTETLPSLALGVVTLRCLTDAPAAAKWLTAGERAWLSGQLAAERPPRSAPGGDEVLRALRDPRVLALCACYFGVELGLYGVIFWIPQILTAAHVGAGSLGYAVALPYAVAAPVMALWCRRSDRARERVRHLALAAGVGFLGLAASAYAGGSVLLSLTALTVGVAGTLAVLPLFWTLPAALLRGAAAAGGIALINALGNIGGFVGPFAVGWIKTLTGSFAWGLVTVACGVLATGVLALLLGHDTHAEFGAGAAAVPEKDAVHNAASPPR